MKILSNKFTNLFRLGIIIVSGTVFLSSLRSIFRIISTSAPDFGVLWYASRDLLTNSNPYLHPNLFTGVGYPPNSLLFYLPLTIFNYELAQTIFILLILVFIFGSIFLSLKISFKKFSVWTLLLVLSLVLLSFPAKFTLGMGQNNSISLFLLLLSYFFYKKKNYKWAGIFLGTAISLKTIFAFFILFFILKKEWKVIFYLLVPITISVVLIIFFSKFSLYEYYFKDVVPPLLNFSGREIYYNQGIMGFISRIFASDIMRQIISTFLSLITVFITSIYALKKNKINLIFSLFIITLLLVDSLSWQHHFIWLIFPFVALIKYASEAKKIWPWLIIFLAYILVSWNFKNPQMFSHFPQILLLSNTFCGTLLLYFLNIKALGKP